MKYLRKFTGASTPMYNDSYTTKYNHYMNNSQSYKTRPICIDNGMNNAGLCFISKTDQMKVTPLTFITLETCVFKCPYDASQYSLDNGETWVSLAANTNTPSIAAGNKIMWKGDFTSDMINAKFTATGQFIVEGNPLSIKNINVTSNPTPINNSTSYFLANLFRDCTTLVSAKYLNLNLNFLSTISGYTFFCLFYGCTSLKNAPNISEVTICGSSSYASMFAQCSSLIRTPDFSMSVINNAINNSDIYSVFTRMFKGCSSLIKISNTLCNITKLSSSCFYSMFEECSSLVHAPNIFQNLQILSIPPTCCWGMFKDCISLQTMPDLSNITGVSSYSFRSMFENCKSLKNISIPHPSTLSEYCYVSMFKNCTSITSIPIIYGNILTDSRMNFSEMFRDCISLSDVPINCIQSTTLSPECFGEMFEGCISLIYPPNLPSINKLMYHCYSQMFDGCTALLSAPEILSEEIDTTLSDDNVHGCCFGMFSNCIALRTPPSILRPPVLQPTCYRHMFIECHSLISAPVLPATTLARSCYHNMFDGCMALKTPPELPATTLAEKCYYYMFCRTTFEGPIVLPAETLVEQCYEGMFYLATGIINITALFTTTPGENYTLGWLNVYPRGTFYKNPNATWDTIIERGGDTVPSSWTIVNAEVS